MDTSPGCTSSAPLGPFLGASPGYTTEFIRTAMQEHSVLPPSNSENSQDLERFCLPFLAALPREVPKHELKKTLSCALGGRGSRVRPLHCFPVAYLSSPLGPGPGSTIPARPGGNSPWVVLLLQISQIFKSSFSSLRQKHDRYPTNQPSKGKKIEVAFNYSSRGTYK